MARPAVVRHCVLLLFYYNTLICAHPSNPDEQSIHPGPEGIGLFGCGDPLSAQSMLVKLWYRMEREYWLPLGTWSHWRVAFSLLPTLFCCRNRVCRYCEQMHTTLLYPKALAPTSWCWKLSDCLPRSSSPERSFLGNRWFCMLTTRLV